MYAKTSHRTTGALGLAVGLVVSGVVGLSPPRDKRKEWLSRRTPSGRSQLIYVGQVNPVEAEFKLHLVFLGLESEVSG